MTPSKRNRSSARFVGWLVIVSCLLWPGRTWLAEAQTDNIVWTRPVNLSNTPQGSGNPAIVADGYGYVHVFWSENMGGPAMRSQDLLPEGNSIYYTRWDGESWTPPVDVLSVAGDPVANFVSVAVDANNRLHAVWTGQTNLYYSSAPAWQAYSALAWSPPVILARDSARSSWMINIAVGGAGDLHVVYATKGDEAGIYYIHASNAGVDWDAPIKLSGALDAVEESYADAKIIVDAAGRLHVAWGTNERQGYGQAVYYARSLDGGKTWSAPVQMQYRAPGDFDVALSYLFARGQSEVRIAYNAGAEVGAKGRYERISRDGGTTWSDPYHILTGMIGLNGFLAPLVDGLGQLHLIIDMRTADAQAVGLYYARWLESGWSEVTPLATAAPYGPSAHYTAATVRLGNELHVVWNELDRGEIWYMRGTVAGVAQTPALSLPALPTPTSPLPTALTPQRMPTIRPITPVPDVVVQSSATITDNPLLYSVGVPFLLVLGAVCGWLVVRAVRRR